MLSCDCAGPLLPPGREEHTSICPQPLFPSLCRTGTSLPAGLLLGGEPRESQGLLLGEEEACPEAGGWEEERQVVFRRCRRFPVRARVSHCAPARARFPT